MGLSHNIPGILVKKGYNSLTRWIFVLFFWRRMEEAVLGAVNLATVRMPDQSELPSYEPRLRPNRFLSADGRPLVVKVSQANPIAACQQALALLGGLGGFPLANKSVLVKPNFNSPHPYPATTDPVVLNWLIECLYQNGAAKVIVGESSGAPWWPTNKVLAKLGVFDAVARAGGEVVIFEERNEWVKVATGGRFFPFVVIPRLLFEVDIIIFLSLLKVHRYARISGALKLAVGLLHPAQRRSLHLSNLEEKIVDLNRACQPDLVIADCRETFITEGPTIGIKEAPGVILASGNPVAVDLEGVSLLSSFEARNRLDSDPGRLAMFRYALTTELAPKSGRYLVVDS